MTGKLNRSSNGSSNICESKPFWLSMGAILQILSVNTFEKTPVFPLLCPENDADPEAHRPNQLRLFGF